MSDDDFMNLCTADKSREVEEAILNGVNVNAKDNDDDTALMLAAFGGQTETAELLLKHGAESTLRLMTELRI